MRRIRHGLLLALFAGSGPLFAQLSATGNQIFQQGIGGLVDSADANDLFGAALAVGDFDADGFDDLAIGVPGEDFSGFPHPDSFANGAGAVHILYGSLGGLTFLGNETFAQQSGGDISGFPEDNDAFGAALSAFDSNGDGADDLAVGQPGSRQNGLYWTVVDNAGAITVLRGSAGAGIVDQGSVAFSQTDMYFTCESAEENDRFGTAVLGMPGSNALFVGVPGEGVVTGSFGGQGRVNQLTFEGDNVFGGCGAELHQNEPGMAGSCEDGDRFGGALAQGDFDGDMLPDLVIGISDEAIGSVAEAGAIAVIPGAVASSGGTLWRASNSVSFDQNSSDILGSPGTNDHWGSAFASGDFDRDGFADLAIGAPGDDDGTGSASGIVQVLYGSSSGLNGVGDQIWSQVGDIAGSPEGGDQFGAALAAGDFDGDGVADLAIGVPFEDFTSAGGSGAINVIYGRLGFGLDFPDNQGFDQDSTGLLGAAEPGDSFGDALAVGDFNSDGRDDLAIGVPGENGRSGLVQILYGSDGGILGEAEFTVSNVNVLTEAAVSVTLLVRRIGPLNLAASVSHRLVAGSSATLGTDFSYAPGTLTWQAGETTVKAITLSIRQDLLAEATESFTVELHSPTAGFGLGPRTRRTMQINDND